MTSTTEPRTDIDEAAALALVRGMVEDHRGLEVLTALWPTALHRPLYTIEDMQRYAEQISPPPVRDEVSAAHDHDCTALNETLGASPLAEPWNEGGRNG